MALEQNMLLGTVGHLSKVVVGHIIASGTLGHLTRVVVGHSRALDQSSRHLSRVVLGHLLKCPTTTLLKCPNQQT